ncbi:MAG: hypothetical protein HY550_10010 [Elusimicrobia bacterium]|nr:hypothetical protein [Elusimicrobiota bacterium]
MKKLVILAVLASMLPLSAHCQETASAFSKAEIDAAQADPLRYTLDPESVTVELISVSAPAAREERGVIGGIITIINIANKIWGVIKDNVPVVEVETKYAAAVPEGAASPNQLYEWKGPSTYEYKLRAKNLYGAETVSVVYKVVFSYGGKFDGKGRYLTGVTIVPGAVNVSWGYKLGMAAFVPDTTITNLGTYEDPLAAMQLKLSTKIASVLKEWNGNSVYLIRGDGAMKEIVSPFPAAAKAGDTAVSAQLLDPAAVFAR